MQIQKACVYVAKLWVQSGDCHAQLQRVPWKVKKHDNSWTEKAFQNKFAAVQIKFVHVRWYEEYNAYFQCSYLTRQLNIFSVLLYITIISSQNDTNCRQKTNDDPRYYGYGQHSVDGMTDQVS